MITDALLQFASAQPVTGSAASTNTIDLGNGKDAGRGEPMLVAITVDQTVAAAGAATVTCQLISSAASNLSSPTVLSQTDAIPKADLVAGRRPIVLRLAREMLNAQPFGQRYVGVNFAVANGPLTAGAFSASVVHDGQAGAASMYPTGYTVT